MEYQPATFAAMKYWKKLSAVEQNARITEALKENIDFKRNTSLGIPASRLDPIVFHDEAAFLKDTPLLRCYVQNPNHIGCHTLGDSESYFKGTQEIEREVVQLLCTDLFKADEDSCDGYIAAGGTEANMQAVWIYRNYFMQTMGASVDEIALLSSEDTHYSAAKAANVFNIRSYSVLVNKTNRKIIPGELEKAIMTATNEGVKYFIVISNMGTTMFGSIDDPDIYSEHLEQHAVQYRIHVDGAFGGFIYPVSEASSIINFANPNVSSITLDAHKMLQAPYGTGIFLVRKGYMQYVCTEEAHYVSGMDITLSGSRSGTNAVAVWMILQTYGPYGWQEKINKLLARTEWCSKALDKAGVHHYRHPAMNIIAIHSKYISAEIAVKFGLVPDTHTGNPRWYKIVVMDHVEMEQLKEFIDNITNIVITV
jgi:glutamate/tyrosine decarboxylase-like PLP-dependent enzyme